MSNKWIIGCSGFHYQHWRNVFYPPEVPVKKWFDYYCERFKTLELNVTFYRFPKLEFLQTWYSKSPDDFVFSVKAPKAITHYRQFKNTQQWLADFYGTTKEGLKEKLGCILFQLPPQIGYTPERLQNIITSLDASFTNVLEFRNESWWNAEVYNELAKHNITFCGMSYPRLPDEIVQNSSTVYYWLHGVPELYKSPYNSSILKGLVDEIEQTGRIKKAFIYFNNDIDGYAITNAFEMMAIAKKVEK